MWLDTGVDFFNQYWPYAALAGAVMVLLVFWRTGKGTRKRVRRLEAQVERLRADLLQIQHIESRRQLTDIGVIKTNGSSDDVSIIPMANSGQQLDVQIDDGTHSAVISPAAPPTGSAVQDR